MSPLTRPLVGAALAASTVLLLAVPVVAEDEPTTTTTSTSSSSTTTTTTRPDGDGDGDGSTTTTSSSTSSSTSTTSSSSTTTTSTTLDPDAVPPEIQARIDAYPRTPAGSTEALVAALEDVPGAALTGGFGRFPVGGPARWSHDWLFPRHEPSLHFHEGTDVFADRGTPVLAPAAGIASVSHGDVGGLAVKVTQADGTWWYLAHLDEAIVADGTPVTPGTVVGTVGDSGNAAGGSPHVHVEIHPLGGEALDPKPVLDAYAAEALAAAPAFVMDHRLTLLRAGAH